MYLPLNSREHGMFPLPLFRRPLTAIPTLCGLLIASFACAQAPPQGTPPKPPPPLKVEQVYDMVSAGVNSVDILVEAKSRLLGFVVDAKVAKELEDRGADELLLNWLGFSSAELQPLIASCFSNHDQKRFNRVVEGTTEILNRSPRILVIYFIRGSAHRAQGEFDAAAADFRQALKFYPKSSRARVLLAETLIADDSLDEARELLQWVVEHSSAAGIQDWPTAHRLLAEAYLKQGEYRLASQELHTALAQLPVPNPDAVKLLPPLESHLSALTRLLALCPDENISSPADAVELALLLKLMAVDKAQQQTALLRLAEAQAAMGSFDDAVATQKAAEILSSGTDTPAIRERLALYEQKQLPLLPPGKTSSGDSPTADVIAQPKPEPQIQVATLLDRMQLIENKSSSESTAPSKPFYLGKFEVTRAEWASVMGNPAPQSPDLPIDRVSWDDCQTFLNRLNEKTGQGGPRFRLPTLAEWTLAVDADAKAAFFFGDDPAVVSSYGWCADNAERTLHPGRGLRENPRDLYDVYGNVAEWCQEESTSIPAAKSTAEKSTAAFRVVVGGSFLSSPAQCSSRSPGFARQNEIRRGLGFRLAADPPSGKISEETSPSEPPPTAQQKPSRPTRRAGLNLAIDLARSAAETEVFQRAWFQERLYILLYDQACVRDNRGDVEQAVENLRALIREHPDNGSPLIYLARCHLAWIQATRENATPEQIAEAGKIVEGVLTRTEFTLWIGYLTQSTVLVAEKKFEDALRRATQASDLAPQQFKEMCSAQQKAVQDRKTYFTREFPISPSVAPSTVVAR